MKDRQPVRTLVEKIPEDILRRTTFRKKKASFKEEAEHLGLDQESDEWPKTEGDGEEESLSGESENWEDDSEKSGDDQDSLSKILAEEKTRHRDRELPQERTIYINRRRTEEKNLRNLNCQGNHSTSYRAIQLSRKNQTGRS